MGCAQAKLFLFEKAAVSFEQASRLGGDPASLLSYLAAMRLHLKEQGVSEFPDGASEYYGGVPELEKACGGTQEGWTASRNESVVAEIKSAFFSGEEEKCGELMEGVLGKLEGGVPGLRSAVRRTIAGPVSLWFPANSRGNHRLTGPAIWLCKGRTVEEIRGEYYWFDVEGKWQKIVMTNMVMLEVADRLLVIDRIKRFKGVAFPGERLKQGKAYMILQFVSLGKKQDCFSPILNVRDFIIGKVKMIFKAFCVFIQSERV